VYYSAKEDTIHIAPLTCPDMFYLSSQDKIPDLEFLQRNGLKQRYLLFVGRFEEYKGVRFLLGAFKLLKNQYHHHDVDLVLIGSGTLQAEIETFIKENNFQNEIKIISWLSYEDLPPWYKNAFLFVFPSYYDPWAFVINEAMAARLPIISTPEVGAVRALIQNGVNGIVVPSKDSIVLAQQIHYLINNTVLREEIADNAYQTALQYKLDKIASNLALSLILSKIEINSFVANSLDKSDES